MKICWSTWGLSSVTTIYPGKRSGWPYIVSAFETSKSSLTAVLSPVHFDCALWRRRAAFSTLCHRSTNPYAWGDMVLGECALTQYFHKFFKHCTFKLMTLIRCYGLEHSKFTTPRVKNALATVSTDMSSIGIASNQREYRSTIVRQ